MTRHDPDQVATPERRTTHPAPSDSPSRKRTLGFATLLYAWGAVVAGGVFFGFGDLPQLCFGATLWSVASASLFRFVERPWAPFAAGLCSVFAVISALAWFASRMMIQ